MKKGLFFICMVLAGITASGAIAQTEKREKAKSECCTPESPCKKQADCPDKKRKNCDCTEKACVKPTQKRANKNK